MTPHNKPRRPRLAPMHVIVSQLRERDGRRRYHDRDIANAAPNRLIGYVSAAHAKSYRQQRPAAENWRPYGRAAIVAIALIMLLIGLCF